MYTTELSGGTLIKTLEDVWWFLHPGAKALMQFLFGAVWAFKLLL
jgi:hypothetical protein